MKQFICFIFVGMSFCGCVSSTKYKKALYVVEKQQSVYTYQIGRCLEEKRSLTEQNALFDAMLRTQLVNNDEILKAARDGDVERAKKLREEVLERRKTSGHPGQ